MSDVTTKDELFFEKKKYLSSKYAGKITGYTNDYIARLCRQGKMKGQVVGKTWYVEKDSLADFSIKNSKRKTKNRELLSKERKNEYVSGSEKGSMFKIVESKIKTFPELSKNVLFKKSVAMMVAVLVVSGAYVLQNIQNSSDVYVVKNNVEDSISIPKIVNNNGGLVADSGTKKSSASSLFANIIESTDMMFENTWRRMVSTFRSFVVGTYKTITQRFSDERSTADDVNKKKIQVSNEREALVVVPSTGSTVEDNRLKQKIKDSFSDEVKVIPDESGRSGIVRPVFREKEGQNYLYMLVPVSE